MSLERIGLNSAFLLLGRASEKAAQFFLLILIARAMSIEAYGIYSLAIYFTALCTILVDWGIQPYTIREVARDPASAPLIFRHGFLLKLVYATSAILFVSIVLFCIQYPGPVWRAILIVFGGRILVSFAQFNGALFRAHGKMHFEASVAVIGVAVLCGATLIALHFHSGILGLAGAWLLYGATELGVSSWLMFTRILTQRTDWPPLQLPWLRDMSKQSFIFGLCSACTLIYFYLDTVMLSKMAPLQAVGRYTAAYNFIFASILLPQVLVDTLFPFLSKRYLGDEKPIGEFVSRISRYFLLIVIPLGFGGALLATPLIRFVYGERYLGGRQGADGALAILVWDGCLIFFTYLFGQVLAVLGKQSRVTSIAAFGALINIALNFILIPRYSLIGAAVATVSTELVILLLLAWSLRPFSLFEKGSFPMAHAAIGTLCMGAFLWGSRQWLSPLFCIACGIIIYCALLVLAGELQDVRTMLAKWASFRP